jgi:hypothetical protein
MYSHRVNTTATELFPKAPTRPLLVQQYESSGRIMLCQGRAKFWQ